MIWHELLQWFHNEMCSLKVNSTFDPLFGTYAPRCFPMTPQLCVHLLVWPSPLKCMIILLIHFLCIYLREVMGLLLRLEHKETVACILTTVWNSVLYHQLLLREVTQALRCYNPGQERVYDLTWDLWEKTQTSYTSFQTCRSCKVTNPSCLWRSVFWDKLLYIPTLLQQVTELCLG